MLITLVRHGQTEENYHGTIQGSTNTLLNDTGRRECQRLKQKIKDINFDYCYMSPMIRTVETAMILVGERVELIPDKRLEERGMGDLEGEPFSTYNSVDYWNYENNKNDFNVEPVQDLFTRVDDFLNYIKNKHADQSILIVTHSAPYRALRHLLLKHKLSGNLWDEKVKNCQMEKFEI